MEKREKLWYAYNMITCLVTKRLKKANNIKKRFDNVNGYEINTLKDILCLSIPRYTL